MYNDKKWHAEDWLFLFVIVLGLAIIVISPFLSSGCSWHVHQKDPLTIAGLEATIKNRESDVGVAAARLTWASTLTARPEDSQALERAARGLEAREKAEQERLKAMLWREQQKTEE